MFFLFSFINLWAMPESDFENFSTQLDDTTFSSDQLSLIQLVSEHNSFTAEQIKHTIEMISFASDRLNALRILAPKIEDPEKAYIILNAFTFSTNKDKAQQIIRSLAPKKSKQQKEDERLREERVEKEKLEKERIEKERIEKEKRKKKKNKRQLQEQGPIFQWVGRCSDSRSKCIRFNPELFSPIYTKNRYQRFTNHDLLFEVTGPGILNITLDLGKKYNCRRQSYSKNSKTKRIHNSIPLKKGRQVIDITNMVPNWKREYVEIKVQKGIYTNMIRLDDWRRCQ